MAAKDKKEEKPSGEGMRSLRAILSKLPTILKVTILHAIGVSETSRYRDLKSEVVIAVIRALLDPSNQGPLAEVQAMSLKDSGVKGKLWVSAVVSEPPPERGIRDALLAAIDTLNEPGRRGAEPSFRIPELVPVEAEWTGYRAAASKNSKPPEIPEEQKYHEMMKECKNSSTILYLHGGGYYLCDPSTYRAMLKRITKLTGGRAFSIRYRLAPQDPFPSALLDALVSYFTLLYPPPGSIHEAVAPGDIVFGGDSAGGNLALALLRTLMEIRHQNRKISWFGEEREVPLPAGVAVTSPWIDMVQTLPSLTRNLQWCYLPPPRLLSEEHQPPADSIWPANPPRKHLYLDDDYMLHQLASLQMTESWEGAPPVYISCGWEALEDEIKYIVSKFTRDGVTVMFEEYEAMPHVFESFLPKIPAAQRSREGYAKFVKAVCEDPKKVKPSYKLIKARTLEELNIKVEKLSPHTDEEVRELARKEAAIQRASVTPAPDVEAKA
ncbi:Alpha/Beta hydrolase protein [Daldinia caldariorum]|uniref:Alpha/Beta hydrolase protein n=1 Tax=Daldinia caldariorum TaxID=326644 RepID=UPI0020078A75|nr:Alpha/Beta hydrolase protein [Daldinia caldariorum]KAI1472828.1 Alpha/Beta hydrolase protein [Daldinia caldariorum]